MRGRAPRDWTVRVPDEGAVREVAARSGLSRTSASILVNRGVATADDAERFLRGSLRDLSHPFLMKDLERAAARLLEAGRRREPVLVYADYDADGATGAAVLALFLREAFPGIPVRVHQNDRLADGYGLRPRVLEAAAAAGVRLAVTVDLGVSDAEAVRHAGTLGMDVVVTDHHVPGHDLPPALAVVNPKRPDCPHPGKELAGAGVAFLLACGVRALMRGGDPGAGTDLPNMRTYLDLVALGTVADVAPLRGENRLLVRAGIEEIRNRPRPGILALLAAAGIDPAHADEGDLGFRLGPRLNAAGRVGDPGRAVALLVADDPSEAGRLAAVLSAENGRRQREEERILREVEATLGRGRDAPLPEAVVLADPGWHPGVLGIVASRVAERIGRPAVLLQVSDGEARGSCRSPDGFSLVRALDRLAPLLSRHGGHHQAAGVALPEGNLAAFREAFAVLAGEHAAREGRVPGLPIDAEVPLGSITLPLMEEIDRLRPFGAGNEEPVLLSRNLRVTGEWPFGEEGRHRRFGVEDGADRREGVAFHRPPLPDAPGGRLDIAFTPQVSRYRGGRSVRLLLRDARPAGTGEGRADGAPGRTRVGG